MPIESCSRPASDVAAGITAYGPDPHHLVNLIGVVSPCVARVYLFVNSIDPDLHATVRLMPKVEVIEARVNLGVGVALNLMCLAATLAGFKRLCVFDQDSLISKGLVGDLAAQWDRIERRGVLPAVVAPRLITVGFSKVYKAPTYVAARSRATVDGLSAVQFVPTSGSMLDLARLRSTGWFNANYFIDGIDLEWCFRAHAQGFSCWVSNEHNMEHPIGTGRIKFPMLGLSMPKQSPVRMYCHFRNAAYGLRLRHIPLSWKLKQIFYLPMQAIAYVVHRRLDPAVVRRLAAGFSDGLRGRLGPPAELLTTAAHLPLPPPLSRE